MIQLSVSSVSLTTSITTKIRLVQMQCHNVKPT